MKMERERKMCLLLGYRRMNSELRGDEVETIGKDW